MNKRRQVVETPTTVPSRASQALAREIQMERKQDGPKWVLLRQMNQVRFNNATR